MTLIEERLDRLYEAGFSDDELVAAELMAGDLIDRYRRSLTFWDWLRLVTLPLTGSLLG